MQCWRMQPASVRPRSAVLFLREGALFRAVAIHSKESYDDYLRRNPVIDLRENPGTPLDRVANSKQVLHIPDLRTDQSYIGKNRFIVRLVETRGHADFCVGANAQGGRAHRRN